MKYIILFLIFLFSLQFQAQEKHSYYVTTSLNTGNYAGISLDLNYVYQENYSFQLGYSRFVREPKD